MTKVWPTNYYNSKPLKNNYVGGNFCTIRRFPLWFIVLVLAFIAIIVCTIFGLVVGLYIIPLNKTSQTTSATTIVPSQKKLTTILSATTTTTTSSTTTTTTTTTSTSTTTTSTTTSTTTTTKIIQCKNGGIRDVNTNICNCVEYFSGNQCEIVAPCDEIGPDDEICEFLKEDPDVTPQEFAAYCPKSAYCS